MYVKIASGRVSTVLNSGTVSANSSYNAGLAYDSTGKLQLDTEVIPATAVRANGIARHSDGVLCVNTADPNISGVNYLQAFGATGQSITAGTKSVTGNLRITIDFQALDYTPANNEQLVFKSSGNNGFRCGIIATTGKPFINLGDGVGNTTSSAVTAPVWTDNTRHTLRIDVESGVGVTFFYDSVQSGVQVANTRVLTNAAVALILGPLAGEDNFAKIYSVSVTDGAFTTYYSVDFTQVTEGTTSFAQNGDTYTITNTGALKAQILAPAKGHGGLLTDSGGALHVHVTDAVVGAVGGVPVTAKGAVAVSAVT